MEKRKNLSDIINIYINMSMPAKASIWFVICGMLQKGIVFITTPIFTRILSKEEFGTVSIYMSWMAIITIFATLELPTGVFNKAMLKYEEDRDGYTSSSLVLASLSTIILFLIYLCFSKKINIFLGLDSAIVVLMFIDIFFTTAITFWSVRKRFEYKYKSVVSVTIIANVVATLLSLIFTLCSVEHKDLARIEGLVLGHVFFYAIIYIHLLRTGKKVYNLNYWKYSIHYNLPLIPHYLSQQILNQSDRIMINSICGKADAAVYSLSYQMAIVINILINSIHSSFMPWTYQMLKKGDVQNIGKRAFQIEILIGSICLIFTLFAPEFIFLLGGKEYLEAVYIIPPVAMSVLFITIYSFFGNIEFYFEKTKLVMIASCIVAVLNLILNKIFIPILGFVAAGYTTLICYIIYGLLHYIFMVKICENNKIKNPYPGNKMWITALIYVFLSICISMLYKYKLERYIIILILSAISLIYYMRKNK